MSVPLKVLLLEDCEADAILLARELKQGGYAPTVERVWAEGPMEEALRREPWDVVISDFTMPSFNAFASLSLLKKHKLDIPFIIVSGTIGEEKTVSAMKAGAADYVAKGNLGRLVPVIARELSDAHERQLRKQTEAASASACADCSIAAPWTTRASTAMPL